MSLFDGEPYTSKVISKVTSKESPPAAVAQHQVERHLPPWAVAFVAVIWSARMPSSAASALAAAATSKPAQLPLNVTVVPTVTATLAPGGIGGGGDGGGGFGEGGGGDGNGGGGDGGVYFLQPAVDGYFRQYWCGVTPATHERHCAF